MINPCSRITRETITRFNVPEIIDQIISHPFPPPLSTRPTAKWFPERREIQKCSSGRLNHRGHGRGSRRMRSVDREESAKNPLEECPHEWRGNTLRLIHDERIGPGANSRPSWEWPLLQQTGQREPPCRFHFHLSSITRSLSLSLSLSVTHTHTHSPLVHLTPLYANATPVFLSVEYRFFCFLLLVKWWNELLLCKWAAPIDCVSLTFALLIFSCARSENRLLALVPISISQLSILLPRRSIMIALL